MSRIRNKCVFLSGPMSDDPETYHVVDFALAHAKAKNAGAADVYDPALSWLRSDEKLTHQEWMRRCLHVLTDPWVRDRVLVSLPGWEASAGARAERMVAEWCGIECMTLEEALS